MTIGFKMMPTGLGLRGPSQRFRDAGKLEEQTTFLRNCIHIQQQWIHWDLNTGPSAFGAGARPDLPAITNTRPSYVQVDHL